MHKQLVFHFYNAIFYKQVHFGSSLIQHYVWWGVDQKAMIYLAAFFRLHTES